MSTDYDIAIGLAPPAARDFLRALFALTDELQQIPAKVTQPTIGLMRIVWWRDALLTLGSGETKAQPILQNLAPYASKAEGLAAYAETFGEVFDGEDQSRPRAEQLAGLLGDVLAAPLPLLYQAALGENPRGYSRAERRAAAPLLFLSLAPLAKTPLARAWLAIRLAFGW